MMLELIGSLHTAAAWGEAFLVLGCLLFLGRGWTLAEAPLRATVVFALVLAACSAVDHYVSGQLSRPEVIASYLTTRRPVLEVLVVGSRGLYALATWGLVIFGFFRIVLPNFFGKGDPDV